MTAGRRDQLASALRGRVVRDALDEATIDGQGAQELADALLPTVDRMIRQAQAAALESAAVDAVRERVTLPQTVAWLRNRAAALRVSDDGRDVAQDAP